MTEDQNRILRIAARDGDQGTIIQLIDAGTSVDAADMTGYTPLMLAARKGQTSILQLLLGLGADWKIRNRPGNTALDYAVQSGSVEAVRLLLKLEGSITGLRGRELLNMASHADVRQLLRDAGASDEAAHVNGDEAREIEKSLLLGDTVLCKVCGKPLTFLWPGNSASSLYGIYCPDGCTEVRDEWRTPKE